MVLYIVNNEWIDVLWLLVFFPLSLFLYFFCSISPFGGFWITTLTWLATIHTYTGYPVVNDPLYNHEVFGPLKGRGGDIGGKTDEQLVRDLINIHNAENWLGIDGDSELSLFKTMKSDSDDGLSSLTGKGKQKTNKKTNSIKGS